MNQLGSKDFSNSFMTGWYWSLIVLQLSTDLHLLFLMEDQKDPDIDF